jgi:transposase
MARRELNTTRSKIGYQADVSDQEWTFCMPYLLLMDVEAPQRTHDLRAVFNGLHYIVRNGCL